MKNKVPFIKGLMCTLEVIQKEEIEALGDLFSSWVNDEIVTYYMYTGQLPLSKFQIEKNIRKDIAGDNILFLIRVSKLNKIVGYCGLFDVHRTARKAEFRVLIGDRNFWGKGLGREVCELVTLYGFDRLNLNRIYLGYTSANKAAAKVYERVGYNYEGTLKQDIYRNSTYYDTILMAILRNKFYKNYYETFIRKYKAKK